MAMKVEGHLRRVKCAWGWLLGTIGRYSSAWSFMVLFITLFSLTIRKANLFWRSAPLSLSSSESLAFIGTFASKSSCRSLIYQLMCTIPLWVLWCHSRNTDRERNRSVARQIKRFAVKLAKHRADSLKRRCVDQHQIVKSLVHAYLHTWA